jgi:hypothetical protein
MRKFKNRWIRVVAILGTLNGAALAIAINIATGGYLDRARPWSWMAVAFLSLVSIVLALLTAKASSSPNPRAPEDSPGIQVGRDFRVSGSKNTVVGGNYSLPSDSASSPDGDAKHEASP